MKLRVYLDLSNAVTRRRVAALLRADGDVALVGTAEDADLVVGERVVRAGAPGAVAPPPQNAALTARELEVLRHVARGLSNKEIAADLGITTHTVKYHLAAVLEKLGVRSRTEAVSLGVRKGLVPL
ncbi:MAG TPA: response regulator transcription factor [Gemmatimonadales bacterium]|nr:response regulator transcription factor [Gemmatimonadales bacterium]